MCESDCFDEMTVDFQVNVGKGFTHQRGRPHTNLCAECPHPPFSANEHYVHQNLLKTFPLPVMAHHSILE